MNSRHENVKGIYAGFRRYLKLGRNHVRDCLDLIVHVQHWDIVQEDTTLGCSRAITLIAFINHELRNKDVTTWATVVSMYADRFIQYDHLSAVSYRSAGGDG